VTADADLLDDLLRLAAAAGVEVEVAVDAAAAKPAWRSAPCVLVGADAAAGCARAGLGGRSAVVMVARGPDEPPWGHADALRAGHVAVLPAAEAWVLDRLARDTTAGQGRGCVLATLGGRGGAGASVLAAALAVTARREGLDTLLVDADPLGGGVDLALGWERLRGLRWPDLVDARGHVNPTELFSALPGDGGLAVLSFDRSTSDGVPVDAMAAVIDAGRRGRDLVVVDVPRHVDDASALALTAADRVYLVVPDELRACAAARRITASAVTYCPQLAVVVRCAPAGAGVGPAEVADVIGLPLAGAFRSEPGLPQALERGEPPAATGRGPLAELARELLADLRPRRHRVVVG
jgi:secretion/DNA translocation related CpaE-like protein